MSIFTARENFKPEFIEGHRHCESCLKSLHEKTALVIRWKNKKGEGSLAICDDECWSTYDQNYWLERRAKKELDNGNVREAERLYNSRLPKYQSSISGEQI